MGAVGVMLGDRADDLPVRLDGFLKQGLDRQANEYLNRPADNRDQVRHNKIIAARRDRCVEPDIRVHVGLSGKDFVFRLNTGQPHGFNAVVIGFCGRNFRDLRLNHQTDFHKILRKLELVTNKGKTQRIIRNAAFLRDKGPGPAPDLQHVPRYQRADRFTDSAPPHAQHPGQLVLARQPVANVPVVFNNQLCNLLGDLFSQRFILFRHDTTILFSQNLTEICLTTFILAELSAGFKRLIVLFHYCNNKNL